MSKIETLIEMVKSHDVKIDELLGKKPEKKKCNVLLWVLAIVGAVAVIAAVAYAVYRYLKPDYLEDFEDEFEDDFEDEFDEEFEEEFDEESTEA